MEKERGGQLKPEGKGGDTLRARGHTAADEVCRQLLTWSWSVDLVDVMDGVEVMVVIRDHRTGNVAQLAIWQFDLPKSCSSMTSR